MKKRRSFAQRQWERFEYSGLPRSWRAGRPGGKAKFVIPAVVGAVLSVPTSGAAFAAVDVCGEPPLLKDRESALLVWKDCATNAWSMVAAGGGSNELLNFSGSIKADANPIDVTGSWLEQNDILNTRDPRDIRFALYVAGAGNDNVDFRFPDSADVCLELDDASQSMLIGPERTPVSGPLNLRTMRPCGEPEGCGELSYDPGAGTNTYLWQDCKSGGWHLRVAAGGKSGVDFAGEIRADAPITGVTPFSFEGQDSLIQEQPESLAYDLFVANRGHDGIDFRLAEDASACVDAGGPVLVGQERIRVESPFDLKTLGPCVEEQPSCELVYDSAREEGTFLWQDCESGSWHLRMAAGGSPDAHFSGELSSNAPLRDLSPFSLESNDVVEQPDPNGFTYQMHAVDAGHDGLDFDLADGATACIDTGGPVVVGPERRIAQSPFDITTLGPCVAEQPECGIAYDKATEQGTFLWKNCESGDWHMRVTGGGSESADYAGRLVSDKAMSDVSGFSLEGADMVKNLGESIVEYRLHVVGTGEDGMDFSLAEDANACLYADGPVVVGPSRQTLQTPFDVKTLGKCVAIDPPVTEVPDDPAPPEEPQEPERPELPTVDLADLGYLDVTTLGADPAGKALSTRAIQAALDEALATGQVVYFPSGTYLVDDTLRCMQPARHPNIRNEDTIGCSLVGSTNGARPVIRLIDNAPSFGDASVADAQLSGGRVTRRPTIKPVLHFWRQQTLDKGASTDPELEDGSRNYNQTVRGLDIDLGKGNRGAVGIRHFGAEGSAIRDVRIDARDGFAGLYSYPSSGGLATNIEIVGGRHGIYASKIRDGGSVLAGLKLSGQSADPIVYKHIYPLTIVGFEISHANGPVISISRNYSDSSAHLAMIDGSIEVTGTDAAIRNTDRSVYLKDVFVRGARQVAAHTSAGAALPSNGIDTWTHVKDYVFVTNSWDVDSVVNGAAPRQDIVSVASVQNPRSGMIEAHIPPQGACSFEDANAVSVLAMGGAGDGISDDTRALREAIAAADTVLLPPGEYVISGTIDLRRNTRLCGAGSDMSQLVAHPGWNESNLTPLLRTPDDASAEVVLDGFAIRTKGTDKKVYPLHWRSGRKSTVYLVHAAPEGPWPGSFDVPLKRTRISGNGGGRFYGYRMAVSWDCMDSGCRLMSIENTREPLTFYMYHSQYLRVAGGPHTEMRNSANVSIYGFKSETVLPGMEAAHDRSFGTPWPILMQLHNCDNIAIVGHEGHSQAEPGRALFEIFDSNNVSLVHIGRRDDSLGSFYPESTWYFVKEIFNNRESTIDATGLIGVFRRQASVR